MVPNQVDEGNGVGYDKFNSCAKPSRLAANGLTMSGRYLLDTNIVIGLFAGDETIIESLKGADAVFVASIVLGGLCFGARE